MGLTFLFAEQFAVTMFFWIMFLIDMDIYPQHERNLSLKTVKIPLLVLMVTHPLIIIIWEARNIFIVAYKFFTWLASVNIGELIEAIKKEEKE